MPKCLYVRFYGHDADGKKATPAWSIGSMDNGVYCVAPKPEYWHVDAKSSHPHMRIRRNQMPVAPDFGRTAYSMQGFTSRFWVEKGARKHRKICRFL